MFKFKILKRSKKSRARLGLISTPHGEIETPAFVPVATRATVRTLESDEVSEAGAQVLICNTYHLYTAPGAKNVKRAGGLHEFMRWKKPLMTDSGGFQVFSLGFGQDHGVGKILKEEPERRIAEGTQPTNIKITEDGVHFRSPFDECPSPLANEKYMRRSLERTHRWARMCLEARSSKLEAALYGIVQGGNFKSLRTESAKIIGAMPFQGFGIGGGFGHDKRSLKKMLGDVHDVLPEAKPRHVLGVGHPEDFPYIASAGGDTFDCIAPTHYARRGVIFTSKCRFDIRNRRYLTDQKPLDSKCKCDICKTYSRAYICHLMRAHEMTGMKLCSYHNLHFFNT